MLTLCMTLGGIISALQTPLVAGYRVLVSLDVVVPVGQAQTAHVLLYPLLPAQRQVGSGHDFDKIHVVEGRVRCHLLGSVEGVLMVVRPWPIVTLHSLGNGRRKLRTEAQVMNRVAKIVLFAIGGVPVVLEVVHVHVPATETAARSEMEVSDYLVHLQSTFDSAALLALFVQSLGVVLACALFDVLSSTERPSVGGIRLANLVTRVAAAGLLGISGCRGAVAITAVSRVEMGGRIVV